MGIFSGRHFPRDIILWAVRWYCRYGVSYRDLEEMMTERGVPVDGAVAKLGGEPRRPSFSFPDGRCVPAFSGRLEDPVDDHRVRIGVPISKHRALTFP